MVLNYYHVMQLYRNMKNYALHKTWGRPLMARLLNAVRAILARMVFSNENACTWQWRSKSSFIIWVCFWKLAII